MQVFLAILKYNCVITPKIRNGHGRRFTRFFNSFISIDSAGGRYNEQCGIFFYKNWHCHCLQLKELKAKCI